MSIQVEPVPLEDKSVLRNLMELYAYDFSAFDGADVDAHGLYGYHRLDHYWTDEGRFPFLVRVEGKLAGLVLVRTLEDVATPTHSIAEFFVLGKYRRQGLGRFMARAIFDRFPGPWEVGQIAENLPAQAFWRQVIGEYTRGDYDEVWLDNKEWHGPMQTFIARPPLEDSERRA